ncbi:MAG: helix-turn-helix transcriptional regulator [Lentisphaerae bacterium]|nr:helix-turn-helix transcriptional regulator [Lentisphaerota bacterium]
MEWMNTEIGQALRQNKFPLNVSKVYFCNNAKFPADDNSYVMKNFEVSLRLQSASGICEDRIDGQKINLPFPHTVFKHPGMKCSLAGDCPRDTISFSYNHIGYQTLKDWGLIPQEFFWEIDFSEVLQKLVEKFRQCCLTLTIAGGSDQLDWVCFQILRELLFARTKKDSVSINAENRIRKAAIYFQHHCNRSLTVEEVARRFGFSRAVFFREWKRIFHESPKEHILKSRLEMAALRLIRSNLSVADIVDEVNFSGVTAFYAKFQEHFGVSPGEFRKNRKLWNKIIPDITPEIMEG